MIGDKFINLTRKVNESISKSSINKSDGSQLSTRPISLALKHIGLGLIKLQFFESSHKPYQKEVLINKESGINLNGIHVWQTVWIDDVINDGHQFFRYLLESRYDKSFKCVLLRSRFCQNQAKMTRINWIHHVRRGHIKMISTWKKNLRKSNPININDVFEIYCNLCNKNKRMNSFTLTEFPKHMKNHHPQFPTYSEYASYFKRCFICNDQTTSFDQNITHRKVCLIALLKDPNQGGTEHFNNCFQFQKSKPTICLLKYDNYRDFDMKLNMYNSFKNTSLYSWSQQKSRTYHRKLDRELEPVITKNGAPSFVQSWKEAVSEKSDSNDHAFTALRNSILGNLNISTCTITLSDRITYGKPIDLNKLRSFVMPVPFMIKNTADSKENYLSWRKTVKKEHSTIQSTVCWYCEICNAMLKNLKSAYCHLKMCHQSVVIVETNCKSCDRRFLTTQGYKNHFQGMKKCPVARRCVVCNVSVPISDIYEHMFLDHKNELATVMNLQTCLICRSNVNNIKTHLSHIHGMSNIIQNEPGVGKLNYRNGCFYNCSKCSLTYFSEIELRSHMILNDHFLECPKCPSLKFFLSWELMHHLHSAHQVDGEEGNQVCDLCAQDGGAKEGVGSESSFSDSNEKINHFLKVHLVSCRVLLTDLSFSTNNGLL